MTGATIRGKRADARRNHDELLAAAVDLFARRGVDAPMELIAQAVGVGQGTLYRHFPTRDHVFAEILADRAEQLRASASAVSDDDDLGAVVTAWLRTYDRFATDLPGMGTRVAHAIGDRESPVGSTCRPMKEAFSALLERAQQVGAVRGDVSGGQLLAVVAALPKDAKGRTPSSSLALVLDGLSRTD